MDGGGSGPANKRRKDAEMAQRLKAQGVQRTTGRCPVCHKLVPNGGNHIIFLQCEGPPRKGSKNGTGAGVARPS